MDDRLEDEVRSALAASSAGDASPAERAEMLMEIAMGLQQRPPSPAHLDAAVDLYERASAICPPEELLLAARIKARKGTALQALPRGGVAGLLAARAALEAALEVLRERGAPEEVAEAEMNLGVVLQSLAGDHEARITDAIAAYQRALRTFDRDRFRAEFAILQNNLATAFLSIPFTDERAKLREALAVQAFEEGLAVVTLVDHPAEYGMLQNNLGNALQYSASSHPLENNLRALEAYEEALKVRRRDTSPLAYANTLSNKANCLLNLPDDPTQPDAGNEDNLRRARGCYAEALEIFNVQGDPGRARIVGEALDQLERELLSQAEPV